MDPLNYHHLHYFWVTATEGNLTRASRKLGLAPSTVSAQIRALEESLGADLFHRHGKRLALTERGRLARGMCDQIFGLGAQLVAAVQDPDALGQLVNIRVGVAGTLNDWLVFTTLNAARAGVGAATFLSCRSDEPQRLLADLSLRTLDVVLGDESLAPRADPALETVLLARLPVVIVGVPELVSTRRDMLPFSLIDAPVLMPAPGSLLRREIDEWFGERGIEPRVTAELSDSGLTAAFGRDGAGLFFVPAAVAGDICEVYGVAVLAELQGVTERVFAVHPRLDPHPMVAAMIAAAGTALARNDL